MKITQGDKKASLFGVHGGLGRALLFELLDHSAYGQVEVFCQKALEASHSRLIVRQVDFREWQQGAHKIIGNDLFICPGLLFKEVEGSFLGFDPRLSLDIVKQGTQDGVNQLFLASSKGAHKDALFPGLQLRGLLDDVLKYQDYWSVHIFRPAVTLPDDRRGKIAGPFGRFFNKLSGEQLNAFEPLEPRHLAQFIVAKAQLLEAGYHIHESEEIQQWTNRQILPPQST
jgi:hypothetical protein